MLLALDTATRQLSLALHDGSALVLEQTWPSDNQHNVQLASAVSDALHLCKLAPSDLTAFAVAIGPGSFTGLRIGVAAAKGMAMANRAALVGVNTLDVAAAGFPGGGANALVACVAAGRGRVVVRSYTWRKGEWRSRSDMRLTDWVGLASSIDGSAVVTGDIDAAGLETLADAQRQGIPITIAPAGYRLRRAGILAEMAWSQLRTQSSDAFDPAQVVPVYVKSGAL